MKCVENLYKKLKGLKFTNYTTYNLDLKYFKVSEFDSPDEPGSGYKMDKEFLMKLDYARGIAGFPFVLTSAFRTKARNQLVGGRVGSSHLKGLAVDIAYYGSRERYIILQSLMQVGITRFGIGKGFIHCDVDKSKDPDVIWLY